MTNLREEYYVKRSGIPDLLQHIGGDSGETSLSVYFPAGLSQQKITSISPVMLPEKITKTVAGSGTGGVVFAGQTGYLIVPPFPVTEKVVFAGHNPEPLIALLAKEYLVGMVLVHLGSYAVGVCRGETLQSSKVGTGLVHGRTRKGGSSSARFQRRRQNQGKEFLERVCVRAKEHLGPHQKTLDYILYGGPSMTVLNLQKLCPFLSAFTDRTLPLLDVPPLKQKVLETSVTRLWASRVVQWSED